MKKENIDNFITKNYEKIKNMAYNASFKNNNTLYIEDLIGEFYIFLLERMKRNDTEEDLKNAMHYYFGCQFFKDSTIKKLNQKDKTKFISYTSTDNFTNEIDEELDELDLQWKENIENKLKYLKNKYDQLPPAYKELYKIIFVNRKWTHQQIAEELNTTIYSAKQSRKKLFQLLDLDEKNIKLHFLR